MKKVSTKSYCISKENIAKISVLAEDLGVSESSIVNAMLSTVLKFDIERMFKDAIQRR